ncbi:unnamed protein product [Thelazia callipaeda]|uniref:Antithrombin-III n=1 Tax=Thelazia callipaeda TaxID=103827 RepID=A0A0N5DAX3_THECL|nr:unnamed protein product [Thelazia callipaeda]
MLIEIEETACFLASFLYGTIPRRRIDTFAAILANQLLEHLLDDAQAPKVFHLVVNVAGKSDPLIQNVSARFISNSNLAAEEAYMDLTEIQSLIPNNLVIEIRQGSVNAVNADTGQTKSIYPKTKPLFIKHQDMLWLTEGKATFQNNQNTKKISESYGRPYFDLQRDDTVYTAQTFAATRFGSTKLKSHQGVDAGNGYHPYTTPSLYAYLQLLIFLNALACLTVWSEKLEQELDSLTEVSFRIYHYASK